MIGINIDGMEELIKKNNFYLSSLNDDLKRLLESVSALDSCYSGSSLEYLFHQPIEEKKNLSNISNIVKNYSDVLFKVKCSYIKQDFNVKKQINQASSKLN